ncbi:hypothetical protein CUJ83_03525 [Methanocella sp. CWC-04]|uniref:Secreted protein containing C-terminal beta-propeller domain n=1 Tax=Methanooceanicella nereidis TaxID=2052831 RepID=A0AAP2RCF6_9EURY|nr:beta-propeller domain-containing protein [Methanocella sp. CWC-04]MCD1294065.1 hypothetical protein [Methanocella sp. CWC-04]
MSLMKSERSDIYLFAIFALLISAVLMISAIALISNMRPQNVILSSPFDPGHTSELPRFSSDRDMIKAFMNASAGIYECEDSAWNSWLPLSPILSAGDASKGSEAIGRQSGDFSTTNVQVEGVDEADIIKTDGKYVYIIAKDKIIIALAYPGRNAEILSSTNIAGFRPSEMFIDDDRLLVFGSSSVNIPEPLDVKAEKIVAGCPYCWHIPAVTSVKLYDISDRKDPQILRTFEIEGSYLTSRKIGNDVYFVVNTYPRIWPLYEGVEADNIIPLCREGSESFKPVADATDICYIPPVEAASFITLASVSMTDEDKDITKETIAGSGQNVYASENNLYITQSDCYGYYRYSPDGKTGEETTVAKFSLDGGKIKFIGSGRVKGHILNQFSMDEYNGYFRIATTIGEVWNSKTPSTNNVYVLDGNMNVVGELEDLAPGEKIYSARFMGKRCYMVTFKKVDPLFVIDLSDPKDPDVLGKLKIPGYSDYLHPYDENHIIGIGKDTVDAGESETSGRGLDFAWYQGVKMAIFDVSDVEHPKEMYKVVIGDRGTDSPVLTDHKAFLFDREKNLLVLPITVAEIQGERTSLNQYGDYVFQGAYVYDVSIKNGFTLRGKVTHYDDDEVFKKSGYYFYGDRSISRSLYIKDVLYTMSSSILQLNDLDTLKEIKQLKLD